MERVKNPDFFRQWSERLFNHLNGNPVELLSQELDPQFCGCLFHHSDIDTGEFSLDDEV